MADKKVSFDFAVVTTILVAVLLIFLGLSGFNRSWTDNFTGSFTEPLFDVLKEDALIYIVCGLVAAAGLGIITCQFVSGMPPVIKTVSSIIALVFWALIIIFRDIAELDTIGKNFVGFISNLSVDLIILSAILQSTFFGSKN